MGSCVGHHGGHAPKHGPTISIRNFEPQQIALLVIFSHFEGLRIGGLRTMPLAMPRASCTCVIARLSVSPA